jgi:hypothetical protein
VTPRARAEVFAGVFLLFVLALAGCGPGARGKALRSTLRTVDTARAAFVVWDDKMQAQIVDEATSLDEGRAKLAAHRAKRDDLVAAFEAAYRMLAAAIAEPDDDRGAAVVVAVASLWTAYEKITGAAPIPGAAE